VAWDVHEAVLRQRTDDQTFNQVVQELDVSGVPYSAKTLWRWIKDWNTLLALIRDWAWMKILTMLHHANLPVGPEKPRREWEWLLGLWDQIREQFPEFKGCGLLEWLYRQARAPAVAVAV